jgi:hypothetical protein
VAATLEDGPSEAILDDQDVRMGVSGARSPMTPTRPQRWFAVDALEVMERVASKLSCCRFADDRRPGEFFENLGGGVGSGWWCSLYG